MEGKNDYSNIRKKRKTKGSRSKLVKRLIITGVIFIVIIGVVYYVNDNYFLSDCTQVAIKNTQNLKNMMKDPDSFKLYDDVLVVYYYISAEDDSVGFYTYIDSGAKNSYGGMARDTAMYFNNEYVGSIEDAIRLDGVLISNDNDLTLKKTHLPYLAYLANSNSVLFSEIVSKEKIMRHIK